MGLNWTKPRSKLAVRCCRTNACPADSALNHHPSSSTSGWRIISHNLHTSWPFFKITCTESIVKTGGKKQAAFSNLHEVLYRLDIRGAGNLVFIRLFATEVSSFWSRTWIGVLHWLMPRCSGGQIWPAFALLKHLRHTETLLQLKTA